MIEERFETLRREVEIERVCAGDLSRRALMELIAALVSEADITPLGELIIPDGELVSLASGVALRSFIMANQAAEAA